MSAGIKGEADAPSLRIEGEMTVYRAVELKEMLLAPLHRSTVLEVDLSAVTEIDSAGVQVLLLANGELHARQGQLRLVAPSPAVQQVFTLLNLATHFGEPPAAPSPAA